MGEGLGAQVVPCPARHAHVPVTHVTRPHGQTTGLRRRSSSRCPGNPPTADPAAAPKLYMHTGAALGGSCLTIYPPESSQLVPVYMP